MTILQGLGAATFGTLLLISGHGIGGQAAGQHPHQDQVSDYAGDGSDGVCRNMDGSDIAITQCLRTQLGLSDGMSFPTND